MLIVYQIYNVEMMSNLLGFSEEEFLDNEEMYIRKVRDYGKKVIEAYIVEQEKYYKVQEVPIAKNILTIDGVDNVVLKRYELILIAIIIDDVICTEEEISYATGLRVSLVKKIH